MQTLLEAQHTAPSRRIVQVDLKAEYAAIGTGIDAAIRDVIAAIAFIRGPFASRFEASWAAYCGASHAVGCANGTAALELALAALGIGPGDEVITTPLTFIATVEAIIRAGARPVFAEIDPATLNLSVEAATAAVTTETAALLPVDLYGQPARMAAFRHAADSHRLALLEDAAQAHGATDSGHRTGADGTADITTFSFYPGKNLGAYGDAGALVTARADLADKARRLSDHGRTGKYVHDLVGGNQRLDGLQGAILSAKLPYLDVWNTARRRLAVRYDELLAPLFEQGTLGRVSQAPDVVSVYHLYVVRIPVSGPVNRDTVMATLQAGGIESQAHYPIALHLQPALRYLGYREGDFPQAEQAAAEVLSLPLHPFLSDADQDLVVAALNVALLP